MERTNYRFIYRRITTIRRRPEYYIIEQLHNNPQAKAFINAAQTWKVSGASAYTVNVRAEDVATGYHSETV